ncbi:MAG TPA: NADPH-dependent FMN reductase [Steroidobacteraceae bacterium]|nr:NADPH-dependent FMN reductase [Steroidobacteraceae bacterium]
MRALAISGSLRAASINSAFCRVLVQLAPTGHVAEFSPAPGELPLFNPDLDSTPPVSVVRFRHAVAEADALVIASPEYAHGVTGVIKNTLDWLVSFEGAVGKPVALVNTSPRARHAQESLAEILVTMSMRVVPAASISLPLLGYLRTEGEMRVSTEVRQAIRRIFEALAADSA